MTVPQNKPLLSLFSFLAAGAAQPVSTGRWLGSMFSARKPDSLAGDFFPTPGPEGGLPDLAESWSLSLAVLQSFPFGRQP